MSHFYGTVQGSRGKATRCGSSMGLQTIAASWSGAIKVQLYHDKSNNTDCYQIYLIPWEGKGEFKEIASGVFA